MALDMKLLTLISVLCQISALPKAQTAYTVADLQAQSQSRGYGPGLDCQYQVQPFLQVAHDLQEMEEQQRVDQLVEWASIESLAEPTIILTRMLIEKSDGSPLRRPYLGGPDFQLPGGIADFPEEPLTFVDNIPFFIVSGYTLGGEPEPATEYVHYALDVGRWRENKYEVIPETKLRKIATKLIGKYAESAHDISWLERWVDSQLGPPVPQSAITNR